MRKGPASPLAGRALLPLTAAATLVLGLGTPAASADSGPGGHPAIARRAETLTITVPNSAYLGTGGAGTTISGSLGTVTVTDSRPGVPPWTATASAGNFTTGTGTAAQTITRDRLSYWSGPTTASSGGGSRTPGQTSAAQAVSLATTVTAFRGRKGTIPTTTSWQPTIVVAVPAAAIAGGYTGVITHSVA
ncbi:hypothetical protein GCM10010517_78280 [Streptosporangium fragile]|uniref:WxL domain-containing protein n=1 Tax=Streptosporangium fragile TaxID=46186 RepID=A0ABN3WDR0_9ACTN